MEEWHEYAFRRRRTERWRGRRYSVVSTTVLLASKPITMVREVGGAFHVVLAEPVGDGEPVSIGMKFVDTKCLRLRHVIP